MTRKIKFRAWDCENNKMLGPETFQDIRNHKTTSFQGWRLDSVMRFMQYTGLKDNDGKELFDGDIVKVNHGDYFDQHGIKYPNNNDYVFEVVCDFNEGLELYCDFEIIGNKRENPDLLNNQQ